MKLQRSGRKLECIPQWESIFGGLYVPGQVASYQGAVEPSHEAPWPGSPSHHHHCGCRGRPWQRSCAFPDPPGRQVHRQTIAGFRGMCVHSLFIIRS